LLKTPTKVQDVLIILISTNKGLCGGLNLNLFQKTTNWLEQKNQNYKFILLGKKGEVLAKERGEVIADFSSTQPFVKATIPIINLSVKQFLKNKVQEVWVIFNDFISALKYEVVFRKLLPFELTSIELQKSKTSWLIEPSLENVLTELLPFYLKTQLQEAILEAEASEHSARMIAMKNATENASTLANDLTLEYNKIRQQIITEEIADIITAKISME
jgi:F-type H+-transporting ATPase subunit gamma